VTLQLWDTPGFGDSVRLLRRLGMSGNPIGWFLREVFDRYRDRPFWLSQNALRAARDCADVVLYLVNSTEAPQDAGYLPAEMKILEWLGKPVIVLLNQLGPPRPAAEEHAEQARWRAHLDQYSMVEDVLALDAFARCWVHERVFYEAVERILPSKKHAAYARLMALWDENNRQRLRASMALMASQLARASRDQQPVEELARNMLKSAMSAVGIGKKGGHPGQEKAMAQLIERLNADIGKTTAKLLVLHHLDPLESGKINARVREHFKVRAPVDKAQAGLIGAIVSGAASGLSADLMAGGMTFGAGALIGGVVGALTMAGAAWGFNTQTDRNEPVMRMTDDFLRTMLVGAVLRYLAVAHFGRGRGNFVESEAPAFWVEEVEGIVTAHEGELPGIWEGLRAEPEGGPAGQRLDALVTMLTTQTLQALYPNAVVG